MPERKYELYIEKELIAESVSMETALIIIKALFAEYYNDKNMKITTKNKSIYQKVFVFLYHLYFYKYP